MTIKHYIIATPEVTFHWIGGPAKPDGDHVWLCNPDGTPALRVRACCVKPSTPEQTAKRIRQDIRNHAAEKN